MTGECWWPRAAPGFPPPGYTLLPAGLSPTPFCSPGCTGHQPGAHQAPYPEAEVAASLEWAGVSTSEVGSPVGVLWRGPFPAVGGIPRWGELRALQGLGATWASAFLPRTTVEWGTSRRCGLSPGAAAGVTYKNAGMQDKIQPARAR